MTTKAEVEQPRAASSNVNVWEERRPVRIRPVRPATRAARPNLAQEPSDQLDVADGVIEPHAKPWELVTVGIGFDA